MNLRSLAALSSSLPMALLFLAACGQKNVDVFNGIVETSSFDTLHSANTDVDGDGITESLSPREGYVDGKVVQWFDFGQVPAFFSGPVNKYVTTPGLYFTFVGEDDFNGDGVVDSKDCDAGESLKPTQVVPGFEDYDPRFSVFSPFRQHDIVDELPDGSDVDQDDVPDYNPIFEIAEIKMPKGFKCNEVLNVDTLRKRLGTEDLNGNNVLDRGEDQDGDSQIDNDLGGDLEVVRTGQFVMMEEFDAFTRLPDLVFSSADPFNIRGRNLNYVNYDADGLSEDLDLDLNFDSAPEFDANGNGDLDDEDLDLDGNLDVAEDTNNNGQLDAGEDKDGDNHLDVNEDADSNGALTVEDFDHDGKRDCGEVNLDAHDCVAGVESEAPVTEDANGNGQLDPGEDGSQDAIFGAPNGILDTEDANGDGQLSPSEDLNANAAFDGVLGGIPAYDDKFIIFYKSSLLHSVPFHPATVELTDILDGDGNTVGQVQTVVTMPVFVDAEELGARPIFDAAPGETGFSPLAEVFTFIRPEGFLPGEISSVAELEALEGAGLLEIEETGVVQHAAFVLSNNDPLTPQTSVFFRDTDVDGIPDFIEEQVLGSDATSDDTDGDGLLDSQEDRNRDGLLDAGETDVLAGDTDGDGVSDGDEVLNNNTNPLSEDTDGDTVADGDELLAGTDPRNVDSDSDGLQDGDELLAGTDPLNADTDNDGLLDGVDGDALFADSDEDGLSNDDEAIVGTDPNDADSDNDGLGDNDEIIGGTDPLNNNTDGDCFTDGTEFNLGSDANDANSPVLNGDITLQNAECTLN